MVKFTLSVVALVLGAMTVAATPSGADTENGVVYKRTADSECWCKSRGLSSDEADASSLLNIGLFSGNKNNKGNGR